MDLGSQRLASLLMIRMFQSRVLSLTPTSWYRPLLLQLLKPNRKLVVQALLLPLRLFLRTSRAAMHESLVLRPIENNNVVPGAKQNGDALVAHFVASA